MLIYKNQLQQSLNKSFNKTTNVIELSNLTYKYKILFSKLHYKTFANKYIFQFAINMCISLIKNLMTINIFSLPKLKNLKSRNRF